MRFTNMVPASSLLIDVPSGEQVVRPPKSWDAIGALLQRIYAVRRHIPDPIARMVSRIDVATHTSERVSDRR